MPSRKHFDKYVSDSIRSVWQRRRNWSILSFSQSLCSLEEPPASKLGVDAGEPKRAGTDRSHKHIPTTQIPDHCIDGYNEHDCHTCQDEQCTSHIVQAYIEEWCERKEVHSDDNSDERQEEFRVMEHIEQNTAKNNDHYLKTKDQPKCPAIPLPFY
jgi:hypothetical protein